MAVTLLKIVLQKYNKLDFIPLSSTDYCTRRIFPLLHNIRVTVHLVNIADHEWREENLRQRSRHGVHGGHHRGVHEVDGVAVEEDGGTAHGHADNHRPEYVLETWTLDNSILDILTICEDWEADLKYIAALAL